MFPLPFPPRAKFSKKQPRQWEDEGIEDRLEQFVAAIKMLSDSKGSNGGIDTNVRRSG